MIWTSKPTSDGGRCNLRGVLKITPPKWAQSVSYHMAFERPTRYSFNIGDSITNNAWGKIKTKKFKSNVYLMSFPFLKVDNDELRPYPYLGSALRAFNVHVIRSSASIITPFPIMCFLITLLHLSFGLIVFRCPPTSIFHVRIATYSLVFLFTLSYHRGLASYIFSPMFATPDFALISSFLNS